MLIIWPGEKLSSYSSSHLDNIFMLHRAAWHGTRIILRQVSPESVSIFDFILEAYRSCDGDWSKLASQANVSHDSMTKFLEYAAVFLANIGNYYVSCV
jgi:dipeptidyl-peptidase III